MNLILEILLLFILAIICYQDLKERNVFLFVLISGIVVGGTVHYLHQNTNVFLQTIFINTMVIGIIFGILTGYANLKMKKKIFEVFGAGDLLFFILLAVSIPTLSFLMIFVFSLLFSLLIFMLFKVRFKDKTIPLAGLQSLFFGLVLIANKCVLIIDLYSL